MDDNDFSGMGTGGFPFKFVRIPDLGKKIRGGTGWFFVDLENGELFAVVIDSTGVVKNINVEECFGLRWKGEVVKLVPKEEKDADSPT